MATLRKRGGKRGYWHALWRDASGRLMEKSTKTSDRKKAAEIAAQWESMSRPTASKISMNQAKKVLAELHRKLLGSELPQMTVRGYVQYWLEARQNEVSDATYAFYKHAADLFLKHLGGKADHDLFTLDKEDIVRFRDSERARVEAKTANHALKIVKMICRQARLDGWTPENPADGVKTLREDKSASGGGQPRREFTLQELSGLIASLKASPEWLAMTVRGYYTGQRLKDIALMRASDEDPVTGQVRFRTSKGKGKPVVIEMADAYKDFVLSQNSHDDLTAYLHPNAAEIVLAQKKTATLSNQFSKLLAAVGLREQPQTKKLKENAPGRSGRRRRFALSFHSLRHSLVSHLQDAGVSRSVVQDIVGHDSEAVNIRYTHLDRKTKQAAMAKLPDITEGLRA